MQKIRFILKSLKLISGLGVPLGKFVLPSLLIVVLELVSLYLLAMLVGNVLSAASGKSIQVIPSLALAMLLLAKSGANASLNHYIYRMYAECEGLLRQHLLNLTRAAPSQNLRALSVETVIHQVNVYPPNLTYNVYQEFIRLISNAVMSLTILLALLIKNTQLTLIVSFFFAGVSLLVMKSTMSLSERAGTRINDNTIEMFNRMGRYLGGRNEIASSGLDAYFRNAIKESSYRLARARALITYLALVPRFALDAVVAAMILVIIGATSAGIVHLAQDDLAFGLAAALKLAPFLSTILASVLQISNSKAIIDGYDVAVSNLISPPTFAREINIGVTGFDGKAPGLELRIKDRTAVVKRGEILVIKGRSGSGKTTIAELISDAIEGRIVAAGASNGNTRRAHLAFCSQFPTVLNESLVTNVSQNKGDVAVPELITRYGLDHLAEVECLNENTLSGGERQRIGIVRSLNQASEIVVFDEPTSSIGTLYAEKVKEDVAKLAASGHLVVVVTHEALFDSIATQTVELTVS